MSKKLTPNELLDCILNYMNPNETQKIEKGFYDIKKI